MDTLFFVALLLLLVPSSHSFDGTPSQGSRKKGDILEVKVNKLSSVKTHLPYDYYSLSYCKPSVITNTSLSLGQVLRGDRIKNSVYTFKMKEEEYCKIASRVKLDEASAKSFKEKIEDDYQVNMILDDLPVATACSMNGVQDGEGGESKTYVTGIWVGLQSWYVGVSFLHSSPDICSC